MSAIIPVTAYYLIRQGAQASPIPAPDACAKLACNDSRTLRDIVCSCLSTIFLCTWVAVHPNIPHPYEKWPAKVFRRTKLMAVALIAPEVIILWATRQWLITRRWAKSRGKGWTQTHSFFALMGGFMLFDDGKPLYTLMRSEDNAKLSPRHRDLKTIDFYFEGGIESITKEEIEDKSKADTLSKGLVLMQTGWFALQCISRLIQHLPLSVLELETVGFAILNLVTYLLWWHKPHDVQYAFPVRMEPTAEGQSTADGGSAVRMEPTAGGEATADGGGDSESESEKAELGPKGAVGNGSNRDTSFFWRHLERFVDWLVGHDHYYESWDEKMVPLLFSGSVDMGVSVTVGLIATTVASVFGAIHCIAWSFQFASATEKLLWRISSCAIAGLPWPLWVLTTAVHVGSYRKQPVWLSRLLRAVGYTGTFLYILARVMLLVLAALSLRSLPLREYKTGGWTTYLPHI